MTCCKRYTGPNQLQPLIQPSLVNHLKAMISEGFAPHFYTDGSCQYPALPTARFASFSVVLDLCVKQEDRVAAAQGFKLTGIMPASLKTILVSRTQGAQRIARSELFAVVLVVETFSTATIHCDSQTTIDRFRRWHACRDPMIWIDSDDFDLLIRLQDAILATHEISKVAAHVDPRFTTDLPTCYQELGNAVANDSAIRAYGSIHPWLVKECQKQCHQLQSSRVSLARWFEMLLITLTLCHFN